MKIHITNLYNFKGEDALVNRQHYVAEAGRSLGFLEMGIFDYPVETDTFSELSKRQDGIIASLEEKDVVFVQLPTRNGYEYENLLVNKIKAYRGTKVVPVFHDLSWVFDAEECEKYESLCKRTDAVIVPTLRDAGLLKKMGISRLYTCNHVEWMNKVPIGSGTDIQHDMRHQLTEFHIQKVLMDALEAVWEPETAENMFKKAKFSEDEVQIGFGLYDRTGNYSVWVGVAMQSVIEHTRAKICFHILHDESLNIQNRNKLLQVAVNGGQRVVFHCLDKALLQDFEKQMKDYTIGALFRILIPDLLDIPSVIYLDADILAHRDVKELWDVDISDYALAAVPDTDVVSGLVKPVPVKTGEVPAASYFNSGVLYMNLERIRAMGNMGRTILDYLRETPKSDLPDQDALNVIYGRETLLLDGGWNTFVRPLQNRCERDLQACFYHFVGTRCMLYTNAGVDKLYYETTQRTPWGVDEGRLQLDRSINTIKNRVEQLEKLLHSCSDGWKKRIYYGPETFAMKNMYQLLSVRDGDYRIVSDGDDKREGSLPCKEFSALSHEESPFIVLVLPEAANGKGIENLEKLGLVAEDSYFVIPQLLQPGEGGYM